MSSFRDNFQRNEETELLFDTSAFYPFLETFLIISTISSIIAYFNSKKLKYKYINEEEYANCKCSKCRIKLKELISSFEKRKRANIYLILFIIFGISSALCYNKVKNNKDKIKRFDPFEILNIPSSADIK